MKKILFTILVATFFIPSFAHAAILNWIGAEGGVTTQEVQSTTGTVAISSTVVFDGQYSFRTNPSTTATGAFSFRKANTDGQTNLRWAITRPRISFWYRIATLPASNFETFADIENSASNRAAYLVQYSTGQISLRDSLEVDIATTTQSLSTNTWYLIQWDAQNGTSASETVSIYDTSCNLIDTITASGNFTASAFGVLELGKRVNRSGQSVDYFFDDAIVDDSTMPTCQMRIGTLMPRAQGAHHDWTGGTGFKDYREYYERPADTTSYASTTSTTAIETALFDNNATSSANIGASDTIHGVNFFTFVRETTNTVGTMYQNYFISGVTNSTTTSRDISTTLVPNQQTFLTDPNTGSAWTVTNMNLIDAGGDCVTPLTTDCRMSQAILSVLYTPAAAPPATGNVRHQDVIMFE